MSADDEAARKARAQRLREQIKKVTTQEGAPPQEEEKAAESPRDFVHRKMRERDEKKGRE